MARRKTGTLGWATRRLLRSAFQYCHLERREWTRSRVHSRSRKILRPPEFPVEPGRHSHGAPVRMRFVGRTRCDLLEGCRQTRGSSTSQDPPRADDLFPLGMTEWRLEARSGPPVVEFLTLPRFAKGAKGGAPLVLGCADKVHRSFVGGSWLCQGFRCLRMTVHWLLGA
jgi:hypothetical protein